MTKKKLTGKEKQAAARELQRYVKKYHNKTLVPLSLTKNAVKYIDRYGDAMAVENLEEKILEQVNIDRDRLDMSCWHRSKDGQERESPCGTTHCLAGFAESFTDKNARKNFRRCLQGEFWRPETIGAFVYAVSRPGKPIPNFFEYSDSKALKHLRERVKRNKGG